MFECMLIANRGEIACRIARTAQKLDIRTVAIYSEADRDALHVKMSDSAFYVGKAEPGESYLNKERIIEAALAAGAQAIHPGYGFLAENPEFAELVREAGLEFIGPSAATIRSMGLKDAAKQIMEQAGVPVVPGYYGENQDPGHLAAEAEAIGWPVLIKAVAGGGGKGMRAVADAASLEFAVEASKAEARSAFGSDRILIEKLIECPRHVEVQIFGDKAGNLVHMFERDCSIQRRYQKVIEEAPAPGMAPNVRQALGMAATKAARAVDYVGAGTVEFIADASQGLNADGFWFMEMNTRLQVEHPVTEFITGLDLVEWQIRVAAGEDLPLSQDEFSIDGHAMEARVCAEDVGRGFLPVTGRITRLKFPNDARVETGVSEGSVVGSFYDPMIAKIVVHGPSRPVARCRLVDALDATEIAGLHTNIAFLRAASASTSFAEGRVDTGFIGREFGDPADGREPKDRVIALAAVAGAFGKSGLGWDGGFAIWNGHPQRVELQCRNRTYSAEISSGPDRAEVVPNAGRSFTCRLNGRNWTISGTGTSIPIDISDSRVSVQLDGYWEFEISDNLRHASVSADQSNDVVSPMPGTIRAILVEAGDMVREGSRIAVIEAMKMETVVAAPKSGVIADVRAASGEQVEAGAIIATLSADDAAEGQVQFADESPD